MKSVNCAGRVSPHSRAARAEPLRRTRRCYEHKAGAVDLRQVMREIDDARDEEAARLQRMHVTA